MSLEEYAPPLDRLLELGRGPTREAGWPDYLQYGFTSEHVPELIRMATDPSFNNLSSERREVWTPLHAWRTLAQLGAVEATEALLTLLHQIDDQDDDWISEELPQVFGIFGAGAIPALAEYLGNRNHGLWARVAAAHALTEIGERHPEARDESVARLTRELERFAENDITLNSFVISYLVDLQAREALPLMREAYRNRRVDTGLQGDIQDVEIELKEREKRSSAPRYLPPFESMSGPRAPDPSWLRTGRNDSCPCGSGLKFKKCCLSRVQETRR